MSESEQPTRRRAVTRERLVASAIEVFAHKGVLGASVEEVCEAAGFTRGAFYSNFSSRDELCLAIIEAQAASDLAAAREAIQGIGELSGVAELQGADALGGEGRRDDGSEQPSGSLDELVDHAVTVFMSAMSADASRILALNELRLYAAREPAIREAYTALQVQLTPAFEGILTEGLDRFRLRLMLPIDEVVALLHAIYDQTALEELISGRAPNSPQVGRRLAAVVRAVIRPAQ